MFNKYSYENITKLTINNNYYYLHNHILQKLAFFDCIFEKQVEKSNIIIEWPVSQKIVQLLFELLDGSTNDNTQHCNDIKELFEFISFAKYLVPKNNLIECYIGNIFFRNKDILYFVNECEKIPHHKDLVNLFESNNFMLPLDIQNALNIIAVSNLDYNFKMNIISTCLSFPYQYPKIYGHICSDDIVWGSILKTTGYNPINEHNFYYFESLITDMVNIDEIIINNVEYTNYRLYGAPKLKQNDIISIKIAQHPNMITGKIFLKN